MFEIDHWSNNKKEIHLDCELGKALIIFTPSGAPCSEGILKKNFKSFLRVNLALENLFPCKPSSRKLLYLNNSGFPPLFVLIPCSLRRICSSKHEVPKLCLPHNTNMEVQAAVGREKQLSGKGCLNSSTASSPLQPVLLGWLSPLNIPPPAPRNWAREKR